MIKILYFAWLRERIGIDQEQLELPPAITTVGELTAWLRTLSIGHETGLSGSSVRCAVNQEFVGPDAPVKTGDEVAFFPPVTGG